MNEYYREEKSESKGNGTEKISLVSLEKIVPYKYNFGPWKV